MSLLSQLVDPVDLLKLSNSEVGRLEAAVASAVSNDPKMKPQLEKQVGRWLEVLRTSSGGASAQQG